MEGHKKAVARLGQRKGLGIRKEKGLSRQPLILEVGGASPLRGASGKGICSQSKTIEQSGNTRNGNRKMHFARRLG